MKGRGTGLIYLASGGMELSWLYAWADFGMRSAFHRPYPLWEAVWIFGLAAALTSLSRGRGWRMIAVIGIQLGGILFAGLWIIHDFFQPAMPFLDRSWITAFLSQTMPPMEWIMFSISLFFTILFWLSGMMLARRSMVYSAVCARFDLGAAAVLALLLIELISYVKVGAGFEYAATETLMFPFFVFGLLAMGLTRSRGGGERSFLGGYGRLGVTLSFAGIILLFCTGSILLFLPYLTRGAELGYVVIKTAASPFGPVLVGILRFIFTPRAMREDPRPSSNQDQLPAIKAAAEKGGWFAVLEEIAGWAILVIAGLVLTTVVLYLLWLLFRWLLSRSPAYHQEWTLFNRFLQWLADVWRCVHRIYVWAGIREGRIAAVLLYGKMLKWGIHSGLPHLMSETPNEYGSRLGKRFPFLEREIGWIVEALNREVYGEMVLDEVQLNEALSAWRRLRSPLNWPSRLRSWFFNPRIPNDNGSDPSPAAR